MSENPITEIEAPRTEPESTMPGPAPVRQDGFPARLLAIIGNRSVRSFARSAGISDTFLRQCLSGRTEPTRTKLVAMARAGDVALEWLVSGLGPRHPSDDRNARGSTDIPLDRQWLEMVIDIVEETLQQRGPLPSTAKKARMIAAIYEDPAYRSLSPEQISRVVRSST